MNHKLIVSFAVIIAIGIGLFFLSEKVNAPATVEEFPDGEENLEENEILDTEEAGNAEPEVVTPATTPKPTVTTPAPAPKPAPAPTPSASLPYSRTVTYSGSKFTPEEVVIVEGGTITFVNLSDEEEMWIATNSHLKHDRYYKKDESKCFGNAFDQCAAVGKGGQWSFTFDRFGEWDYHNHERGKDTGTVNVMTKEDYLIYQKSL